MMTRGSLIAALVLLQKLFIASRDGSKKMPPNKARERTFVDSGIALRSVVGPGSRRLASADNEGITSVVPTCWADEIVRNFKSLWR
jgi:hypothetical protein